MGRESTDNSFEAWITSIFGRQPDEMDSCDLEPEVSVAYLTNLFENASSVLAPFSDTQLTDGFWYLISAGSNHLYQLLNTDIAWIERKRCIDSIFTLFEHFLARRCSSHLSHLDEPGANPLNGVCYMWWDSLPIAGAPDDPTRTEVDEAFLDVMSRTLELASDACLESALHGLGHWHLEYPTEVEAIIALFLERHIALRSELKVYALAAQYGCVL